MVADVCIDNPDKQYDEPTNAQTVGNLLYVLLLLLLLFVSCHRLFLPGCSLEPVVIPTAQASSFTLQCFPYYVLFQV
jgi:hypothetical protein